MAEEKDTWMMVPKLGDFWSRVMMKKDGGIKSTCHAFMHYIVHPEAVNDKNIQEIVHKMYGLN